MPANQSHRLLRRHSYTHAHAHANAYTTYTSATYTYATYTSVTYTYTTYTSATYRYNTYSYDHQHQPRAGQRLRRGGGRVHCHGDGYEPYRRW
ncbi:MAG: hypothetical protein V3S55_07570 [Nitrospiraceae bacterium]